MNEDRWFLEGFKDNTNLRNSSQVARHFKTEEPQNRQKTTEFAPKGLSNSPLRICCVPLRFGLCNALLHIALCALHIESKQKSQNVLIFQAGSMGKSNKSYLNLESNMPINKEHCIHFYSFKKLVVQGKGQSSKASRQGFLFFLLTRVCSFLL